MRSEDPARDPQYAEPAVDNMRAQKDEVWSRHLMDGCFVSVMKLPSKICNLFIQELERYRKMAERKAREAARDLTATTGNTGKGSAVKSKKTR